MSRRAAEHGSQAVLDFQCRDASASWPDGRFGVVSMIDVMHHVPREAQRDVFRRAVDKLDEAGVLIYKDMARAPAWQAWANRLHDLLVAREWIQYAPIEAVEQWAAEAGLALAYAGDFDRYWYRHELRVFRRP
jgi:2-polyprenyl-3-methyl-5-hydroxy-6-metoxy-1,4-benzoquinol methylase